MKISFSINQVVIDYEKTDGQTEIKIMESAIGQAQATLKMIKSMRLRT